MKYGLSPLLTDLYQLTMMQAYHDNGMEEEAVFELFFRKLPQERQFLIACGLEQVLEYLENLHFTEDDIDFLRKNGRFSESFLQYLTELRFTGSVHAMPEGTVFFPDEPIIRVTAPLPIAQLVETRIINILMFQTMICSKAIRMKRVMQDKVLVDYGLRRSHGSEAGLMAARASYIAGFHGTATVLAGKLFDIPIYGTMAHSFIQAHDSEHDAFLDFARSHPDNAVLLIDTFDTEQGAEKVVELSQELKKENIQIRGVRLDSGDMISLSKKVRSILDKGGLSDVLIFASGNLDEYKLADFKKADAPVDGFGIGTKLTTSSDVPYHDCAYKLVEFKGEGRRKMATHKTTWPGKKQVFRKCIENAMESDILGLDSESHQGTPLLKEVMSNGKRIVTTSLAEARLHVENQLKLLPSYLENSNQIYPVHPSQGLRNYADEVSRIMISKNK